jgi:hypothetical protein
MKLLSFRTNALSEWGIDHAVALARTLAGKVHLLSGAAAISEPLRQAARVK